MREASHRLLNKNLKLNYFQISNNYLVPYSTVRRIWLENYSSLMDINCTCLAAKRSTEYWQIIANNIQIFVKNSNRTFDEKDIHKKISYEMIIAVNLDEIWYILKNYMNFSFKKCSSKPMMQDCFKLNPIRALHTAEFINFWNKDSLFVNVDELLFMNNTKQLYSWLPSGKCSNAGNILFTKSKSMIVAITSNRDWFATYLTQNYCSDVFIFFHEEFNFVDKSWLKARTEELCDYFR